MCRPVVRRLRKASCFRLHSWRERSSSCTMRPQLGTDTARFSEPPASVVEVTATCKRIHVSQPPNDGKTVRNGGIERLIVNEIRVHPVQVHHIAGGQRIGDFGVKTTIPLSLKSSQSGGRVDSYAENSRGDFPLAHKALQSGKQVSGGLELNYARLITASRRDVHHGLVSEFPKTFVQTECCTGGSTLDVVGAETHHSHADGVLFAGAQVPL